jgi:hypothetical protein
MVSRVKQARDQEAEADDPAGSLAMANLHTFAVTGPMSREYQKFATGPPISPPSDYYNLAIFFEPKVRNRPSVTVLQQVTCYETALPKIAKPQCDLDA